MRLPIFCLHIFAVIFLVSPSIAASLNELRNQHYAKLNRILTKHQVQEVALIKRFQSELKRVRDASIKTGSLERMEAIDREIFNSIFANSVPVYDTGDGEVARIRDVYSDLQEYQTAARSNQIIEWLDKYDEELVLLEQQSILENKVHLAKGVRAEKSAINQSALIMQAREFAIPEERGKDVDPGPKLPSFETDWHSLVGIKWHSKEGGHYFERALKVEKDDPRSYKGRTYFPRHFLYSHSPGKFEFRFLSPITGFNATGCIEDRSNHGNVTFTVTTDEGEVHRSEGVNRRRSGENIDLTFEPSRTLILEVHLNGGGAEDWAFWLKPVIRFGETTGD